MVNLTKQSPSDTPLDINAIGYKIDSSTKGVWMSDVGSSSMVAIEKQLNLCVMKMYDLASDIYNLKCPIDVLLKVFNDEILASIPDLEIYGEGFNETEALNNLKDELIDLFDYLNSVSSSSLGKLPKRWKKIINSFIEKNNAN